MAESEINKLDGPFITLKEIKNYPSSGCVVLVAAFTLYS